MSALAPALAPDLPRPDALLTPAAPGAAYAADVARLNGRAPVSPADDAWLALAHAVARASALPPGQRAVLLIAGAERVAALLPAAAPAPMRAALGAAAEGLHELAAQLGRRDGAVPRAADAERAALHAAVGALQVVVAQQEQAGGFLLAFSTLAALREALAPVLDARSEGLLLAQQGRVARQLGALASAAELYDAAVRVAREAREMDVVVRSLLGTAALATVRGNYPEARTIYRRALRLAARAGADEQKRAGHHGLLVAALAANDVETALAHGWAAFRETSPDAADERAEMLLNLGAVSRYAGEHRASLGACLSALELTDAPHLRLPALGTAALAAVQLGEDRLFSFLVQDVERTIARSGQPFESARALVEFAEAAALTCNPRAGEFASRAATLAAAGRFHEILVRAEQVCATLERARRAENASESATDVTWSQKARTVLRSLERLSVAGRYAAQVSP